MFKVPQRELGNHCTIGLHPNVLNECKGAELNMLTIVFATKLKIVGVAPQLFGDP